MTTVTHFMQETKTEYSTQARQWLVYPSELTEVQALTAGRVVIFPAGQEGKRAALLSALTNDNPAVAALVEALCQWAARLNQPALIDRAIRAGYMIHKGQLYDGLPIDAPGQIMGELARVQSDQNPAEFYAVGVNKSAWGAWFCECRDWRDGRAQQVLRPEQPGYPQTGAPHIKSFGFACKHVLAVYMANRLDGFKFKPMEAAL